LDGFKLQQSAAASIGFQDDDTKSALKLMAKIEIICKPPLRAYSPAA
jgi:hypothetical protein